MGHSLGGFVALELAAQEQVATQGVVLVSGSGAAVMDAVRRPWRGGLRLPGFAGMLLAMRLLATTRTAGRGFLRALCRMRLLRAAAAPLFAHPARIDRTVVDALADEIRPAAFVAAARAARAYDRERWRLITTRIISLRGRSDVFAGAHDGEAFARLIPMFVEHRIEDAGHFAHIERPDVVLSALRSIDRLRSRRRSRAATVAA
ncbi:hypothetical protein GCM10009775_21330 [Microbacterium aoyamense]|uniref:AB hydrolase-1 domain-containing protein n=1 Tax=Microbacterium aoyamense TaxID=344166 RepID=A0ABN2PTQ0_9MICO